MILSNFSANHAPNRKGEDVKSLFEYTPEAPDPLEYVEPPPPPIQPGAAALPDAAAPAGLGGSIGGSFGPTSSAGSSFSLGGSTGGAFGSTGTSSFGFPSSSPSTTALSTGFGTAPSSTTGTARTSHLSRFLAFLLFSPRCPSTCA